MASINQKVIDELRALQTAGAPSFLAELIDLFLKDADAHMAKLGESLASRNAPSFERSAHTMKGSCGNLGAQAMSRMCGELQNIGRSADWARAADLLPELQEEYRQVKIELQAEKGKG